MDLDQVLPAFLAGARTASLATVDERGQPHAANLWFVHDQVLALYWVSDPASAHSRHLARDPCAAVTIYQETQSPDQIHGLQMHGRAVALDAGTLAEEQALAFYTRKFPFVTQVPFADLLRKQRFYRFTPVWLRWIDNRVRFGFKVEREMSAE